jgi:hypothetical protein
MHEEHDGDEESLSDTQLAPTPTLSLIQKHAYDDIADGKNDAEKNWEN